ncbi:MAG: hypothetical protein RI965_2159 [Bacteroidota bacterium]
MYLIDLEYFPRVNYIINLYKSGSVHFSSLEPFKKSTFRNKMQVSSSSGILTLSIPLRGGRSVKLTYGEVEIDYKANWQNLHFKTIRTVYGSAPYFQFYAPVLSELYAKKIERLFDWNILCFDSFLKLSKMSNMIQYSSTQVVNKEMLKPSEIIPNEDFQKGLELHTYEQVFSKKIGFKPNMSCIDMLMNLGPDSGKYIMDLTNKLH